MGTTTDAKPPWERGRLARNRGRRPLEPASGRSGTGGTPALPGRPGSTHTAGVTIERPRERLGIMSKLQKLPR